MATNIEIKAHVRDFETLQQRLAQLSDTPVEVIEQEDIFFHTPADSQQGRLKLRILAPQHGQLIYYERPDATGPKASNYFISATTEPDTLRTVLTGAWGIRGVVRKRRRLYLIGQTRVHLDQVEDLGNYMELEVVMRPDQNPTEGEAIAADLMVQLGIASTDLVQGAYLDLLAQITPSL